MNKHRNEYVARIGDAEYLLRATIEAFIAVEDATKKSFPQLATAFATNDVRFSDIIGIIKGAAVDKSLNEEKLMQDIQAIGLIPAKDALTEFFAAALYGIPAEKK